MNQLLEAFLAESREALESIGTILIRMEKNPDDAVLAEELFRLVHTLKGSSSLFRFPELTRVLHAGEDLMSDLREGLVEFDRNLADRLLDAMDFVSLLCEELGSTNEIASMHATRSVEISESIRALRGDRGLGPSLTDSVQNAHPDGAGSKLAPHEAGQDDPLDGVPEAVRDEARRRSAEGIPLQWIHYVPAADCFYHGEDPLHLARQTPGLLHGRILAPDTWPSLEDLDAYRCVLEFRILASVESRDLVEHFRYVTEQVRITPFDPSRRTTAAAGSAATDILEQREASLPPDELEAMSSILAGQRRVLGNLGSAKGRDGRLRAAASVLECCAIAMGGHSSPAVVERALEDSLASGSGTPLLQLLDEWVEFGNEVARRRNPTPWGDAARASDGETEDSPNSSVPTHAREPRMGSGTESSFGRRADDHMASRALKVDPGKIDRLMNLIGEMVVAKNALPYLARRAEEKFGARELSREIKSQHASINRITDEMQDAIMQVRMMAVSVVFQRFPRLVRDVSHQLGKEVELVLEGEETEADKNIVESLADPLLHMIRNSLDHGLESPEIRRARGKPAIGRLTMRASQEADKVLIEIQDDGNGIDPAIVKRKAYEKGLIDEKTLETISDRDAVQLVFAAGFSTAEAVSDLSGRGVGMDVVRTAVEKVHGTITLESDVGKGTLVRIALPLSMTVTKVMVVESDGQIFGIPMDIVSETVRIKRESIHSIQHSQATILRGKVIPLKSLNGLLSLENPPRANQDDLFAVLVVRLAHETLGLIVDDFRETLDVIQKPLGSVLEGLAAYSGSALLGDGKVLMVLNLKEMV